MSDDRARQATKNAWKRLEKEFGLLASDEAATILGAPPSDIGYVDAKRMAHQLIGARVAGAPFRYPGFQFDRAQGTVLPVVEPLLKLATDWSWTSEDLALWLCAPSTNFRAEDRPVDHLLDIDSVLAAAKLSMDTAW